MTKKRSVEIFSPGYPVCEAVVAPIDEMACPSCKVTVLDMSEPEVAKKARGLGIGSIPVVVIDGELADCCTGRGFDEAELRAEGIG